MISSHGHLVVSRHLWCCPSQSPDHDPYHELLQTHQSPVLHWPLLQRVREGWVGGGAEMLLIRLNCLQNAPPPSVMVINPGIFGDHQLWLCPLVKLSRYGAQVYLFLPAEIICIHTQYFKQFSCQIMFADPGKFSIFSPNNKYLRTQTMGGTNW